MDWRGNIRNRPFLTCHARALRCAASSPWWIANDWHLQAVRFLIRLSDGRRNSLKPTAGCAQSSQALCLSFTVFSLTLLPSRFLLLLLDQESPPSCKGVASLSKNIFDNHVDINSGALHPLESILFQFGGEWRGLLKLQDSLLLRGILSQPRMLQDVCEGNAVKRSLGE